MRRWARRAIELHDELADLADVARDPRGGCRRRRGAGVDRARPDIASTPEPSAIRSSVIGVRAHDRSDRRSRSRARMQRARAAAISMASYPSSRSRRDGPRRDGERCDAGARARSTSPRSRRRPRGRGTALAARFEDETGDLGEATDPRSSCVTVGEEPVETARHGHRRAWVTNGVSEGPWLGPRPRRRHGHRDDVPPRVDGYGHAWLAARSRPAGRRLARGPSRRSRSTPALDTAPVAGGIPLRVDVARADAPAPRAIAARLRARAPAASPRGPARRAVLADVPDPRRTRRAG